MNLTRHNYEEYFLLYVDGELADTDRLAVEAFLQEHPDLGEEMDDLRRTVLSPADDVFTIDKTLLYRPLADEAGARVIPMTRWRLSVAAAVAIALLGAGALWIVRHQNQAGAPGATAIAPAGSGVTPATHPDSAIATAPTGPAPAIAASGATASTTGATAATGATASTTGARRTAAHPTTTTPRTAAPGSLPSHDADPIAINDPLRANPIPHDPAGVPQDLHPGDGTAIAQPGTPVHKPLAIPIDTLHALAINQNHHSTVTTTASPTYHTLEDGNEDVSNDRILFVPADQVVNGEVKGFFRRAGRLIKRSASLNDVVRPESDR